MSEVERLRAAADRLLDLPYAAWHFGDSVAFEAMLDASRALGDRGYAEFARGFVRAWEATRTGHRPLDCTAPGLALCTIAAETGDGAVRGAAIALAEYLTRRPRIRGVFQTWATAPLREPYGPVALDAAGRALLADPGPGVFLDCLHFDPPFFAGLGTLTGDRDWLDLAVQQAVGYVELLQDPSSGLFRHFYLPRTGEAHIPGWGRGQGWALLGLLSVLERAGAAAGTAPLVTAVGRLAAAMVATQRGDGHWDATVDDPGSGVETSTACFMAVGLRRAAEAGLAGADARVAADRAYAAAVGSSDDAGVLEGVSVAVWASTLPSHYAHVPRGFTVPWGQGPFVLMLADRVRAGDRVPA